MGNRFARRNRDSFLIRDVILPVAIIFFALIALDWGLGRLSAKTSYEQLESARNAVTRATAQCYAIEGQYPMNIRYLEENYGLNIDNEKYIVHYQVFASNIMPDIDVLPRDMPAEESRMDL